MDTVSKHLLLEYHGCDGSLLDHVPSIESLMRRAAEAAGATVVAAAFHQFAPQGVSGVVVVEESHLSIHTWPEYGYVAVDVFTCGECEPMRAHAFLSSTLAAERSEIMLVERGRSEGERSMRVAQHYRESAGGCAAAGADADETPGAGTGEIPWDPR